MGCIWTWCTSCRIFHGLCSRKNVIPRREVMGIPSILRECSWICTEPTSLSDLLIIYRNLMSKSLLSKPLKKGYTNDFPQETWGILPSPCYPWNQWGLNRAVGRAKHGQIASGNETWLAGKLHCLFNPIHIYICIYMYIIYIYVCLCWLFFSIFMRHFPSHGHDDTGGQLNHWNLRGFSSMIFPLNPAFLRYFQITSDNHVYHCPIIFRIKSRQFLCPTKSHQSFMESGCSLPQRLQAMCWQLRDAARIG